MIRCIQLPSHDEIKLYLLCLRYGFLHMFRVGSVLATLSVSVERFIAIIYPLRTIKRTFFLITTSLTFTIIYNIPRFFEFETTPVYLNVTIPLENEPPTDEGTSVNRTMVKVGRNPETHCV